MSSKSREIFRSALHHGVLFNRIDGDGTLMSLVRFAIGGKAPHCNAEGNPRFHVLRWEPVSLSRTMSDAAKPIVPFDMVFICSHSAAGLVYSDGDDVRDAVI